MGMDDGTKFSKWTEFYKASEEAGTNLVWPNEVLIRLFKGDYLEELDKNYKGKSLIDIGFGDGNNLRFFATLGLELFGTEVSEGICSTVKARLAKAGIQTDLRVGTNRGIPYAPKSFDFLVSWSVLHYEGTEPKICMALEKYRQVLKTGGRFFIATAGPHHKIMENSRLVGTHQYQIGRPGDLRTGQVMFYFDRARYLKWYLEHVGFQQVRVGRVLDTLFDHTADYFIATGVK